MSREIVQMANRHRKRCSASLIIREMPIKTTRYHFIPIGMTIITKKKKNPTNNKRWKGCGERKPSYTVDGNVNWYSHYGELYVSAVKSFSRVRLFVTLLTFSLRDPLSIGFSKQEYWSGLPCSSALISSSLV